MALNDEFERSQIEVRQLKQTPSSAELLNLYALFKQVNAGDVTGARPGMLDFKARAKYDAWAEKKGQAKDACMQAYVDLTADLKRRYGA